MKSELTISKEHIRMYESHLRDLMIKQVKEHLMNLVEDDIESLARQSVVDFLAIRVGNEYDAMSLQSKYLFSFVNNITKTVEKKIILEEVKEKK